METTEIESTESHLRFSGYFECEQWSTEAVLYRCLDKKTCKGRKDTPHGYWLRCLRGCKEVAK